MKGIEIYKRDTAEYNEYSSLLQTLRLNLGENGLFALLEKAEKLGKKLAFDNSESEANIMDGDIVESAIIFE